MGCAQGRKAQLRSRWGMPSPSATKYRLLKSVAPDVKGGGQVVYGNRNWYTNYRGDTLEFFTVKRWAIDEGALFLQDDIDRAANVCVLKSPADILRRIESWRESLRHHRQERGQPPDQSAASVAFVQSPASVRPIIFVHFRSRYRPNKPSSLL